MREFDFESGQIPEGVHDLVVALTLPGDGMVPFDPAARQPLREQVVAIRQFVRVRSTKPIFNPVATEYVTSERCLEARRAVMIKANTAAVINCTGQELTESSISWVAKANDVNRSSIAHPMGGAYLIPLGSPEEAELLLHTWAPFTDQEAPSGKPLFPMANRWVLALSATPTRMGAPPVDMVEA